ncbi:MAG: DUF5696 domain-containing protein [Treponema sp.]|nr:DUF5696 domain-containing protein [Treponema sp.]
MKKSVWLLLTFFTLFSVVSCSRRTVRPRPIVVYEYNIEEEHEDVVLENEFLSLRFLPDTAEIILTEKATGNVWRSNPPGISEDPIADPVTRYLMESQLSVDYADNSGVGMSLYSSVYSVERGAYEYGVVDGALEVRYTVGDIARTFRIPPAMTEERMLAYLDRMEYEDRSISESVYRLYDINNLRLNDDRNQLLRDYPDLTQMKLYVLRGSTPDYMKEMVEDFFRLAGYTNEEFAEDTAYYTTAGGDVKPAFSITLRYMLDGKSLLLNVPFDKIGYRSVYPITQLTLLPFMGAGSANDEGYLFVPDGSGALIYFNNGKNNQIPYNIGIYGWDEAMPRDAVISDNKAPFPVFGIQKNGSAMVCIIEEGAVYASVRADVSGRNCSWNRVYPLFEMVHGATMDFVGRNERAVYLYESTLPEGENITLRYTLCENPGYMGMAMEYRSWLLDRYPSLANRPVQSGIPIAVEIVGAINKTQHRMGIPFDLPLRLTSYSDTEKIINELAEFGWRNVNVKLNGWFNRSVDHTVPVKIKLINELGSRRDFRHILTAAEKNNFKIYPEVDFLFMRDVKAFGGFNLYTDASRYVNRERVQRYPFSFVWFGERKQWGKLNYLARPEVMFKMIDNFTGKSAKMGMHNIAFRNMGSKLAGDYNERRYVSRQAAMSMRQEKLAQLDSAGAGILINAGFDYAVPWASVITDMNLDDQGFGITDTSVPFFPAVLHGLVPFTGRAINLAEDYTRHLLKTVESGAGLYFSFMIEETAVLQETKFRQFYANDYNKWVGDANALYRQFSADFGHLYNQAIVDHIILSPGVTVTVYEDGTRVIVNLGINSWDFNGRTINANSYIVLKGV